MRGDPVTSSKSNRWVPTAIYGVSVPAGVAGAASVGSLAALPLLAGAACGLAVGWWVNQILNVRRRDT